MIDLSERIREASHTILCCWEDWTAVAGQSAQQAQNDDEWFAEMYDQLDAVIGGLVETETAADKARIERLEEACQMALDSQTLSAEAYEQKHYPMAGPTCLLDALSAALSKEART